MKNFIGILAISFLALSASSLDNSAKAAESKSVGISQAKKDYFFMKDGKMMVTKNGEPEPMTASSVHLTNGSTIKNDGTIEMQDGSAKMLREGEYIDFDGKIGKVKSKR